VSDFVGESRRKDIRNYIYIYIYMTKQSTAPQHAKVIIDTAGGFGPTV
jgi:hypothetical protein